MTEIIRIRQLNQFGNREGKRGQYVILYVYEIYYCFPYYFDKASDITIVNHKHSPSIWIWKKRREARTIYNL